MRIGVHIWIGKGLESVFEIADELECDCFQIFLQNPRSWNRKKRSNEEVKFFKESVRKRNLYPVVVHMPYIMNLASPDREILSKSKRLLEFEMMEAEQLDADYYVIHPGSHKGKGIETGIKTISESIKPFVSGKVKILLENTAGQGNTIGGRWEDFLYLFEVYGNSIGICFDTAHSFQAGYDIRKEEEFLRMIETIETKLVHKGILLVHANDSASPCGSHLDRHQHIGKGMLGIKAFEIVIKNNYTGTLPFIIETPKLDISADKRNLSILKNIGMKYQRL